MLQIKISNPGKHIQSEKKFVPTPNLQLECTRI